MWQAKGFIYVGFHRGEVNSSFPLGDMVIGFLPDCKEFSLHDATYQLNDLSTSPSVKRWSVQLHILLYLPLPSKTSPH